PCRFEHRGVDHARAEDLDPSRSLADRAAGAAADPALHVHLRRRLGEWEVGWPKTRSCCAEQPLGESVEGRLEIDEADALVDAKAFDLVECRRMRRVEEVAPIDGAGNEHAKIGR